MQCSAPSSRPWYDFDAPSRSTAHASCECTLHSGVGALGFGLQRTLFVWIVDCCLFYFTTTGLGEGLNEYSLLQLTGFVILVIGTLVYDKGDVIAAARLVGEAEVRPTDEYSR